MINVTIHGEFGEIYGKNHKFKVNRLLEITNALEANNPGVKNYLISKFKEGLGYAFIDPKNPNKEWKTAEALAEARAPKEIHIVPTITGAFLFSLAAAFVGFAVSAAATIGTFLAGGGFLANLAIGVLIQGVMSLLFPVETPKPQTSESKIDMSSYIFSNLENNAVQGFPIPLLYGELRVGSNIISTNVTSEDLG